MANRRLISFLGTLVNILWYIAVPALSIIFVYVLYILIFTGNLNHNIPISIPQNDLDFSITPNKPEYRWGGISHIKAQLVFNTDVSFMWFVVAIVLVVGTFFLILAIIYNLRKIFRSLKAGQPFAYENFSRLTRIGFFVMSFTVLDLGRSLFNRYLLNKHFWYHGKNYHGRYDWGIDTLLIGLLILVFAEIFRHGYNLKTENESFI
jgi:hypothetical protein